MSYLTLTLRQDPAAQPAVARLPPLHVVDGMPRQGGNAEQLLLDSLDRLRRAPDHQAGGARVATVLHLSRLRPPAPRPHHRRIARSLLLDTAQSHDGQVFGLRNGDLVLLSLAGPDGPTRRPSARRASLNPAELPAILTRLLRIDAPEPDRLVSVWPLSTAFAAMQSYARARLGEAILPEPQRDASLEDGFGQVRDVAPMLDQIRTVERDALLHRQIVVQLGRPGAPIRPLFCTLTADVAARDPFLARHLARSVAARVAPDLGQPPPHRSLDLAAEDPPGLAGAAIALVDAAADLDRFHRRRDDWQRAGVTVAIEQISHLALPLVDLASLRADLFKLDWAPAMRTLEPETQTALAQALVAIVDRVVLHGADDEAALVWGLSHGIRRFQGKHVDRMLAAERMLVCAFAGGCSLGDCTGRAAAAGAAGRRGCRNLALLDGVERDQAA